MFRRFSRELTESFRKLHPTRVLRESIADVHIELLQVKSLLSVKGLISEIPPKNLQIRVSGAYDANFFAIGHRILRDLEKILEDNGTSIDEAENILDFGCGCGRVLIPLTARVGHEAISGTDIDKPAITWLRKNYGAVKSLNVNSHKPPMTYAENTFDFVYGVSVFTHLPEKMQHSWLKEIARIMRPGSLAVFTTHGERYYRSLPRPALQELMENGFYYSVGAATDGLPDFYQTSYQTHDYIRRSWTEHFDILDIRTEGIAGKQDAVVFRKRV